MHVVQYSVGQYGFVKLERILYLVEIFGTASSVKRK